MIAGSCEENAPGGPASPYAIAKMCSTAYAQYASKHTPLKTVSIVLPLAYGPGQSSEKLIPHLIRSYLLGQEPALRQPDRVCDPVFIGDVVAGLLRAPFEEGPLEVKRGCPVPIGDVAKTIGRLVNEDAFPVHVMGAVGLTADAHVLKANTDLRTGLMHTIGWQREDLSVASLIEMTKANIPFGDRSQVPVSAGENNI